MNEAEKTLLDVRMDTINTMLENVEADVESECLPCLEHHMAVISSTLMDIQIGLEEKLDEATDSRR
jgi:hypothetical protein